MFGGVYHEKNTSLKCSKLSPQHFENKFMQFALAWIPFIWCNFRVWWAVYLRQEQMAPIAPVCMQFLKLFNGLLWKSLYLKYVNRRVVHMCMHVADETHAHTWSRYTGVKQIHQEPDQDELLVRLRTVMGTRPDTWSKHWLPHVHGILPSVAKRVISVPSINPPPCEILEFIISCENTFR